MSMPWQYVFGLNFKIKPSICFLFVNSTGPSTQSIPQPSDPGPEKLGISTRLAAGGVEPPRPGLVWSPRSVGGRAQRSLLSRESGRSREAVGGHTPRGPRISSGARGRSAHSAEMRGLRLLTAARLFCVWSAALAAVPG